MTKEQLWDQMIGVIKTDVIPATGCTEPISLAYASAVAAKHLGCPVERVEAKVSANLMKNGMGVMVPGTGMPGLTVAAAIGVLDGDPEAGLQVLGNVHAEKVEEAKAMIAKGQATVGVKDVPYVLYSEAKVFGQGHWAQVCIANAHTNIIGIYKDGQTVFEAPKEEAGGSDAKTDFLQSLTLKQIYEFATEVPFEKIKFIKQAAELNDKLSEVGRTGQYGVGIGHALEDKIEKGYVGRDLLNSVVIGTVSAADARMGGAPYPAMINSGSGNQGIAATEPVSVVARHIGADEETLVRALALSHMTALYVHGFLPKLSALCASYTAAMGGAAGMAWLLAKDYTVVADTLSSMTGDSVGMICDGAANSCALKVGTSSSAAFRAVMLAMDGRRITGHEGLVANDVDESIRNIGTLATKGMQETDCQILDIMLHKNQ